MSIAVMSRVWSKSQHKGNALLLLLAIADNADDGGWCWPGIEYLAKKVKVTPQSIIRITKNLEGTNELTVLHNRRTGNKYVVRLGMTDEELAQVLRAKAGYLGDEQISNILLHNACVTSEVTDNVSSEVTPMLDESSLTVNEPSHVATATPAPADANDEPTAEPRVYGCDWCGHPAEIWNDGAVNCDGCGRRYNLNDSDSLPEVVFTHQCSQCNRGTNNVTGSLCPGCFADWVDAGSECSECHKPKTTTADMSDVHNTCTCKQEGVVTEHFGERPERAPPKPTPHWTQAEADPRAAWGAQSDEFQRQLQQYREAGREVQFLGADWQQLTQLAPDWADKKAVKSWASGLWKCLKAAGGDASIVLDATRKAITEGLTIANPYSVLKMTQGLLGERKRGPLPSAGMAGGIDYS